MLSKLSETGVGPEFLLSEANGHRSRESITLHPSGLARTLRPGTVLGGPIDTGALTAEAGAVVSGTGGTPGNGAISAVTADVGAKVGVWRVVFIEPTANLGTFQVFDPDGGLANPPTGVVGAAYNGVGGINFSVADGSADFVAGDTFPITVTMAAATGAGRYGVHDPEATNGLQVAGGLLYGEVIQGAAEVVEAVGIVRDAEVMADRLVWDDQDAGEKAAALARLESAGIIAR